MQRNYTLLAFCLLFSLVVVAENTSLQSEHKKYLQEFNDTNILSGEHQALSCGGKEISMYTLDDRLSTYSHNLQQSICRVAQVQVYGEQVVINCTDRIIEGEKRELFQYKLIWDLVSNPTPQVTIEQDTYLLANKIALTKAKATLNHCANQMYKSFSQFKNEKGIRQSISLSLSDSRYLYATLQQDIASFSINSETRRFQITKSFGVSTNNTQIYIDFGYPVIDIKSIKVKGVGGVGFHERSAGAPSVIYFAGIAYPNKSSLVTVTVNALPVPVEKKDIKIVSKIATLSKHQTDKLIDFGYPVINLRALSVVKGAGGVYFRQVTGNGVYLKSGVYNTPGYLTLRLEVAVYK